MGGNMFAKGKMAVILLLAFLCISVTMMSSTLPADTRALSNASESMVIGGGSCSDFLNGFAVGMGVASLLGCVWCPATAIAAKVVELIAC
jgi:flagellar motor component MotA